MYKKQFRVEEKFTFFNINYQIFKNNLLNYFKIMVVND